MNTPTEALTVLVANADIMSREAHNTQEQSRYGRRFDLARAKHLDACMWLQANARQVWDFITSEGDVSAAGARMVLASVK